MTDTTISKLARREHRYDQRRDNPREQVYLLADLVKAFDALASNQRHQSGNLDRLLDLYVKALASPEREE